MNESRQQLYLNLINNLLTCDEGREGEILQENADLIDTDLVQMMERVGSVLEERDARQQGEWLQELANRLAQALEMPPVSEREERGVERQVRWLERRFGKEHLYFAYHAAFPLALTPDLCYQIWANFPQDIDRNWLNIPWIAVADLLLSGLCHPVGNGLYELDLAVRNWLLKELRSDSSFGEARIKQLSRFMLKYVEEQIKSDDEDIRDSARVQRWTALAYVKPGAAARELALTLQEKVREGNKAELVRLSSVLENLAEPLRGEFEPLLVYGRGMGKWARGDSEGAKSEFQGLGAVGDENGLWVSGVRLLIPKKFAFGDGDVFEDLARRFGWRRDYLDLIQLLLDCLAGEEGEVLRRHQNLVDWVLVETMREVASLLEVGEGKAAGFLVAVADTLAEAFDSAREVTSTVVKYEEKQDASNEGAIADLVELIRTSKSEDTIRQAIRDLGEIGHGSNTAIAALVELIRTSKYEDTIWQATKSLGKIGQDNDIAIDTLVKFISNDQFEYALQLAVLSLGKIAQGNNTAIDTLVKLIGNTRSWLTLRRAAESLEKIGQGNDTAIVALVKLMKTSEYKNTLQQATRSLKKIGQNNETAIAALVELISTSQSEVILRETAESLGTIDPGNKTAIAALVKLITNSQSEDTIRQTAESLGTIDPGNKTAIAALVKLIGNTQSKAIRWQAAKSLNKIDRDSDTAILALVKLIGTSQSENILWQAAEILGKIGQGSDTAILALVKLIGTSQSENILWQAAKSLGEIGQGSDAAVAALVKLISNTQSELIAREVVLSLGKIGQGKDTAIAALVKLIGNTESLNIIRYVTESLEKIGHKHTTIAALVELIDTSKFENTRLIAANILDKIDPGNDIAIAALVELINNSKFENTRLMAANNLGKIDPGNYIAIAALVKLTRNTQSEDTRLMAANNLGEIDPGNDTAIATLVELIKTSKKDVLNPSLAARSLEKIGQGSESAIAALEKLLATRIDEYTRELAAETLRQIKKTN